MQKNTKLPPKYTRKEIEALEHRIRRLETRLTTFEEKFNDLCSSLKDIAVLLSLYKESSQSEKRGFWSKLFS